MLCHICTHTCTTGLEKCTRCHALFPTNRLVKPFDIEYRDLDTGRASRATSYDLIPLFMGDETQALAHAQAQVQAQAQAPRGEDDMVERIVMADGECTVVAICAYRVRILVVVSEDSTKPVKVSAVRNITDTEAYKNVQSVEFNLK